MCKPEAGVVRECSQEVMLLCVLKEVQGLAEQKTLAVFFLSQQQGKKTNLLGCRTEPVLRIPLSSPVHS